MNKKKSFFATILLISLILCCRMHAYALPDLSVSASDISFSNQSPEVNQSLTIAVQVSNTGDAYGSQVHGSTVSSYTTYTSSDVYGVNISTWYAQYFVAQQTFYIGRVSLLIDNQGDTTDDAEVQIRAHDTINPNPRPIAGTANFLASAMANHPSSTPAWVDFDFDEKLQLTQGTTYWICFGNQSSFVNRYRWGFAHDTDPDMIAMTFNQGAEWYDVSEVKGGLTNDFSGFYRVYQTTTTRVLIYNGDPSSGGNLLHTTNYTEPLDADEARTTSFSWTPTAEGTHEIYVVVDQGADITESDETDNTAFARITVANTYPSVTSADPADAAVGINISVSPGLTFSEALDDTTISTHTVALTAVQNNLGETVNTAIPGTVVYNAVLYRITFIPDANLDYNYTYRLKASNSIKDAYGHTLQADHTLSFSTVIDNGRQHTVKSGDGTTQVSVPAEAVGIDTFYIDIQTDPDQTGAVLEAMQKISNGYFPSLRTVSNGLRSFTVYASSYPGTLQSSVSFASPVTITIPYTDSGNGTVLGTDPPVQENTLAIYMLNEDDKLWIKLPGSQVDTVNNRVSADVSHFSYFALIGEHSIQSSQTYAYPVPYKPNSDPMHTSITFTGLSAQATIKIYTITGELVKTIHETDGDGFNDTWTARDVASGMYIYRIDNGSEQKTGQLLIIK